MGSYSPEATAASDLTQKQKLATTEESDNSDGDSDTENDEIDTALQAEKHVEQILQLVERSASKAMHRREERQQAAKLKLKDTTAAATSSTIFSSADGLEGGILTSNDDSAFDDHFGDHPDTPEAGGVEEIASFAHTEGNTAETQPSATSDVAAAAATAVSTADTTAEGIRDLVIAHIANILNTGSYEEVRMHPSLVIIVYRLCAVRIFLETTH